MMCDAMGFINKNGLDIVLTVNNFNLINKTDETIEKYSSARCHALRMNFAKSEEINTLLSILLKAKNTLNKKIILDFPFPKAKPRIFMKKGNELIIKNNEYYMCSINEKDTEEFLWIDSYSHKIPLLEGQTIYYGDGEGMFIVEKVDLKNCICILRANNDFSIINGKSININVLINMFDNYDSFLGITQEIAPEMIAFSFVENGKDISQIKKHFNLASNILLMSKLETNVSMMNVDEISSESDALMLGRGDLGIYSDFHKVGIYQNIVMQKYNMKTYIATDVLDSLRYKRMPSRSDIADLTQIIFGKAAGVVLSAGIENFEDAIDVIRRIEQEGKGNS